MATMTEKEPMVDATATTEEEQEVARRVAIICSKGSLDMAYPGLIMANAARMMGMDAMIFFTFWGLDIVTQKKVEAFFQYQDGQTTTVEAEMLFYTMEGVA